MHKKILFFILSLILFSCSSQQAELSGEYILTASDEKQNYLVGCVLFLPLELPFRISFLKEEIEFKPALVKQIPDSFSTELIGFRAKYTLNGNKLSVLQRGSAMRKMEFTIIYSSDDSLVLMNPSGKLDYYKKNRVYPSSASRNPIWKFEIETSKNISTCFPYKVVIDTTGVLYISGRSIQVEKQIDKETLRALFERINSIDEFTIDVDSIQYDDSRKIYIKAWVNNIYREGVCDLALCSYDIKRIVLIFDDFVYNYSPDKEIIVR